LSKTCVNVCERCPAAHHGCAAPDPRVLVTASDNNPLRPSSDPACSSVTPPLATTTASRSRDTSPTRR